MRLDSQFLKILYDLAESVKGLDQCLGRLENKLEQLSAAPLAGPTRNTNGRWWRRSNSRRRKDNIKSYSSFIASESGRGIARPGLDPLPSQIFALCRLVFCRSSSL